MLDFLSFLFVGNSSNDVSVKVAQWGVLNTVIWVAGFIATCTIILLTRRTMKNTAIAHVFGRVMDHNKLIYDLSRAHTDTGGRRSWNGL